MNTEIREAIEAQDAADMAAALDERIAEHEAAAASADDQADDDGAETIDIVVDGRALTDDEVEALLQKPVEELTEAEREGLQPLFDAVAAEQPKGVDPLALATDILTEAAGAFLRKPAAAQRLEHKIALGQAIATLVQAQATRQLAMLTQQQLQLVMHAQQQQIAKAAGPAGILIPQPNVRLQHG